MYKQHFIFLIEKIINDFKAKIEEKFQSLLISVYEYLNVVYEKFKKTDTSVLTNQLILNILNLKR